MPTGTLAFSCTWCGTVHTYNESRLDQLLWGSPWRRALTYISGLMLFSGLHWALGRKVMLAVMALLLLALVLRHFFSSAPAYKVYR